MTYAVVNDGQVVNIINLEPFAASDFPDAVETGDYPVSVGDTYTDGVFYRNGERVLTLAESFRAETADMKAALTELGVTIDE